MVCENVRLLPGVRAEWHSWLIVIWKYVVSGGLIWDGTFAFITLIFVLHHVLTSFYSVKPNQKFVM